MEEPKKEIIMKKKKRSGVPPELLNDMRQVTKAPEFSNFMITFEDGDIKRFYLGKMNVKKFAKKMTACLSKDGRPGILSAEFNKGNC